MLKKIGIGAAVVIVLFVIVVATRPSTFTVTRSATMAAPPSLIYGLIANFHKWAGWSPWEKLDPQMKKTFEGGPAGTGSVYAWAGNDQVGEGRMTITGTKPGARVEIKLEFIKPFTATNQAIFDIKPDGAGSTVTWTTSGDANFLFKAMGLFKSPDDMMGPDFERGLANMKTLSEAEVAKQAEERKVAEAAAAAAAAERAAAEAAKAKAAAEAAAAAAAAAPAAKHKKK